MESVSAVAASVSISRQLLEDCGPDVSQYIVDIMAGRIPPPAPKVEPVAEPEMVEIAVYVAPGEAQHLIDRCLCGHLVALHNHDREWGDSCDVCDCTELRPRT